MTDFDEVARDEIAMQFVRVPDGLAHIRRAWDELEAAVDLHGRHFYGAFDPVVQDYRACVEARKEDDPIAGLEIGTLPGGRYLRARLRGEPPGIYGDIKPTFDALVAQRTPDTSRPSLEHYRRRDEIDLLLPI